LAGKERLDVILVNKGYFQSRERARGSIMAGIVFVNNEREDKPGARFTDDCDIQVKEDINPYVSRGGLKLEKAMKIFEIDLSGKKCLDVGASTGGFTDCMLKKGAVSVIAVDVGYGQLAWELRTNENVTCMERTNIRYVKLEDIGEAVDFATIDVSFISLKIVLPVVKKLLKENGEIICLIKPQFEAGREKVGKKGVVRNAEVHKEVIQGIINFSDMEKLIIKGLTYSPIKGPEGNIEYLLYLSKEGEQRDSEILSNMIEDVVATSHSSLSHQM